MREVEVSRFVAATADEIARRLSPARIIEYEGTFSVADVTETDHGTTVTGRGGGMEVAFAFERRENGYVYTQEGEQGPFDTMETTLSYEREREGCQVRLQSSVSLGLPPAAVTDRLAAWKRRGELERALDNLAADVE